MPESDEALPHDELEIDLPDAEPAFGEALESAPYALADDVSYEASYDAEPSTAYVERESHAPKRDVVRVTEEEPFSEPVSPRNGSSLIDNEPEAPLARIRVRTEPGKRVVQEEIPFDAVPDVEEPEWLKDAPPKAERARAKSSAAKAPVSQDDAVAAFASSFRSAESMSAPETQQEEHDDEPFTALGSFDVEVDETGQDEEEVEQPIPVMAEPAPPARPAAKKAASPLRRRTAFEDEIPEGYV